MDVALNVLETMVWIFPLTVHLILIGHITFIKYLFQQLSSLLPCKIITSLLDYGIKIQWQRGSSHKMNNIIFFLCHLLPFSHSAPEPDTHLHVYLPPEGGQGSSFLFTSSHFFSSSKGKLPTLEEDLRPISKFSM